MTAAALRLGVEKGQALLQVQGRAHSFQGQAQLNHRKGDIRLDADDDRLRPAQFQHVGNAAQRAGGEGVDDVQNGDVDDDTTGAKLADTFGQVIPQLHQVGIGEHRLNGGDQVVALFEKGNVHGVALVLCRVHLTRFAGDYQPV